MITLLRWIWSKIAKFFTLLLPMLGHSASGLRPWLFWILHVVVLGGVLVGLWWVNERYDLARYVEAPTNWLAHLWLPLLALILYANAWTAVFLWRTLRPLARPSPFPDIDQAWEEERSSAERAGIHINRLPVFLIVGRPVGDIPALFEAARVKVTEYSAPGFPPVRLFASREAVFVASDECSLLGSLAGMAAVEPGEESEETTEPTPPTIAVPSLAADADSPPEPEATPVPAVPLAKDPARIALLTARLRHLCHLLRETRRPLCPINGIVLLVPETCTRTSALANQAGYFAAEDLRAAAEVLQLRCPVVGIVCDCEQIPGFDEFLKRVPMARRKQRLGRKLPSLARLPVSDRQALIQGSVRWVTTTLVPRLVYRVMPSFSEPGPNARLLQLTVAVHARTDALVRFFTRALAPENNEAVLPIGCYFAATGRIAETQGFLTDVLSQLLDCQNFVAWTAQGRREEAIVARRTVLGYILIGLTVAIVIGLAVFRWLQT